VAADPASARKESASHGRASREDQQGALFLAERRACTQDPAEEVDLRPMARPQKLESQVRYARYIIKFVCYALRFEANAEARMIAQESDGEVSGEDDTDSRDDDEDNLSGSDGNRAANHQAAAEKRRVR
jgi:hypothetical protein